jgi:hypothetical protein
MMYDILLIPSIENMKLLFLRLKLSIVILKMLCRLELLWLDLIAISTTTKFSRSLQLFVSFHTSGMIFLIVYG